MALNYNKLILNQPGSHPVRIPMTFVTSPTLDESENVKSRSVESRNVGSRNVESQNVESRKSSRNSWSVRASTLPSFMRLNKCTIRNKRSTLEIKEGNQIQIVGQYKHLQEFLIFLPFSNSFEGRTCLHGHGVVRKARWVSYFCVLLLFYDQVF
jgi:hypothetical protein